MRIKTFYAADMAEAMRQVREAMGDDAVIVSTYRSRRGRGVEVTAADEAAEPVAQAAAGAERGATVAEHIARALAAHGVPQRLTERLSLGAAALGKEALPALAEALEGCFGFAPLATIPPRPLLLIGPPGAGKTVTVAKLAARAVMSGIKVSVITCDTVRAGGIDQLAAFTRLLHQPLTTVETPEELGRAVARAGAEGPVLIDSPGTNPFEPSEVADLSRFAAAADLEPILVLANGGDPAETAEAARLFAGTGAGRLILTRLDASRRLGGALAAIDGGRLRLADVSITPFVAQGLQPLRAAALARLLLRDPSRGTLAAQFEDEAAA